MKFLFPMSVLAALALPLMAATTGSCADAEVTGQWETLFDGETLAGWHKSDKTGHGNGGRWRAEDGAITGEQDPPGSGNGGILLTNEKYGDFELEIDIQPDWGVCSGLFIRSTEKGQCFQVMVDYHDEGSVGQIYGEGSGAFVARAFDIFGNYNADKKLIGIKAESGKGLSARYKPHYLQYTCTPDEWVKAWKLDDWNQLRVRCAGHDPTITSWINGQKVCEFDAASFDHPRYDRKKVRDLLGREGHIAVQVHGGKGWPIGKKCRWRNIRIKRIAAATPQPAEKSENPPRALPDPGASSPTKSMRQLQVRDGFQVELVAAEPLVADPVAIDWGDDGRLWVVEMADYPLGVDGNGKPGGRIRFLEDTDGDGRYDKSTLFLENINFPNGILAWRGGVLVTAAPEIFYAEDTDGDGEADIREVLYSGFTEGNQQLRINGLRWGLDNWVHCANGLESQGAVASLKTGATVNISGRDLKIRPDEGDLDASSGGSQFGRNRDAWGNWFGLNNSYPVWHYVLPDRYTRRNPHVATRDPRQLLSSSNPKVYPAKPPQKRFHSFEQSGRFTSACGPAIYRDHLLFGQTDVRHVFTCEPFHNLVQHNLLEDDGTSFTLRRAEDDGELDFLASTDRWFRPAMARTGPDGALWVVDVYRYMIEHPRYLTEAGRNELRPFFREGDNQGRIYRVVPEGVPPRPMPRLGNLSLAELVRKLESPNGWIRDKAQQLLLWRGESAACEPLEELLATTDSPLARLHALCTLDGLDALPAPMIIAALSDRAPGVRRHALRLAESRAGADPELAMAIVEQVSDTDAKVRLQLAFTLGELSGPDAASALAELAAVGANDPFLTAAIVSSVHAKNWQAILEAAMAAVRSGKDEPDAIVGPVLDVAAAEAPDERLVKVLRTIFASSTGHDARWQLAVLGRLAQALAKHERSLDELVRAADGSAPQVRESVEGAFSAARQLASDPDAAAADRVAAIRLLGRSSARRDADVSRLAEILVPQTSPILQSAAVDQLAALGGREVGAQLLAGWEAHAPALRSQILSVALSRREWVLVLLDRIEKKQVRPADLDAATERQLANHDDHQISARAKRLLATPTAADRAQILEKYQSVIGLTGTPERGKVLFKKTCSACHKLDGVGNEVGANLASLSDKSPATLLNSILDPSRSVDTRYVNYVALTDDGLTRTGMISAETGNSVTLIDQQGKQHVLLRSEIEVIKSTGKSVMPDGLEKDLSPQDLADVISYVRGAKQ